MIDTNSPDTLDRSSLGESRTLSVQSPLDEEEKTLEDTFGEKRRASQVLRPSGPEAIAVALEKVKTKKNNDFKVYRLGLNTYSNGGSGSNTAGTATPTSIDGLLISGFGSECSYDDTMVLEEGDVFHSSGCSTPLLSIDPGEPEVTLFQEVSTIQMHAVDALDNCRTILSFCVCHILGRYGYTSSMLK